MFEAAAIQQSLGKPALFGCRFWNNTQGSWCAPILVPPSYDHCGVPPSYGRCGVQIRQRALVQYTLPFKSVNLSDMGTAFGLTPE